MVCSPGTVVITIWLIVFRLNRVPVIRSTFRWESCLSTLTSIAWPLTGTMLLFLRSVSF